MPQARNQLKRRQYPLSPPPVLLGSQDRGQIPSQLDAELARMRLKTIHQATVSAGR
jgi:hypothetical protein